MSPPAGALAKQVRQASNSRWVSVVIQAEADLIDAHLRHGDKIVTSQ